MFTLPCTALPSPLHFRKTLSQLRLLNFRTCRGKFNCNEKLNFPSCKGKLDFDFGFFLGKIKITSDPIVIEEEDICLGNLIKMMVIKTMMVMVNEEDNSCLANLLNSSHWTLVADSTLLVTPCNTRLARERRLSLIFNRASQFLIRSLFAASTWFT